MLVYNVSQDGRTSLPTFHEILMKGQLSTWGIFHVYKRHTILGKRESFR